jgi:predicted DNA-binding protein (UPF0251 family)
MLDVAVAPPPPVNPLVWRDLPDDELEVLWLTYALGLSCDQAAKAAGMSSEDARACLLRARLKLLTVQDNRAALEALPSIASSRSNSAAV